MSEGEDVASDGLLGFSSVCGEQRVYGRDVVRAVGNIWDSGVKMFSLRMPVAVWHSCCQRHSDIVCSM